MADKLNNICDENQHNFIEEGWSEWYSEILKKIVHQYIHKCETCGLIKESEDMYHPEKKENKEQQQ